MAYTKSKKRVTDHGEVFTPRWVVEEMLNQFSDEAVRIDARFLEPACGAGYFLTPVLERKLQTVDKKYRNHGFDKKHYALFSLMCIYGIELLEDNVEECRDNLVEIFNLYLKTEEHDIWAAAARKVVELNIVQGDALTMTTPTGHPIIFPEWAYLRNGDFSRRDFKYDALTERSSFEGTLWEELAEENIFVPVATFPRLTVREIAV